MPRSPRARAPGRPGPPRTTLTYTWIASVATSATECRVLARAHPASRSARSRGRRSRVTVRSCGAAGRARRSAARTRRRCAALRRKQRQQAVVVAAAVAQPPSVRSNATPGTRIQSTSRRRRCAAANASGSGMPRYPGATSRAGSRTRCSSIMRAAVVDARHATVAPRASASCEQRARVPLAAKGQRRARRSAAPRNDGSAAMRRAIDARLVRARRRRRARRARRGCARAGRAWPRAARDPRVRSWRPSIPCAIQW